MASPKAKPNIDTPPKTKSTRQVYMDSPDNQASSSAHHTKFSGVERSTRRALREAALQSEPKHHLCFAKDDQSITASEASHPYQSEIDSLTFESFCTQLASIRPVQGSQSFGL